MRATAGLHVDQTPGEIGEKRSEVRPAQFLPQDDTAVGIDAMKLKDVLGQINTDGLHRHLDPPLSWLSSQIVIASLSG
jgi:hypothetical protein